MGHKDRYDSSRMTQSELDSFKSTFQSLLADSSSSSLSIMAGENFEYRINGISLIKPERIDQMRGEPHGNVCGVFLKSEGDLRAAMLVCLADNEAKILAARLLGKEKIDNMDSIAKSSISEVGNILFAGSFLNALYKSCHFKTCASVPCLATGELRGLMEGPVSEIGMWADKMVMADSELIGAKSGISLRMILILSEDDARKIISPSNGKGA